MLPPRISASFNYVFVHKNREHEIEQNKALRELDLEMARKGLSQSSAFIERKSAIYCDTIEKYALNVWNEMQGVMMECGFEYYSGCEADLKDFLEKSLAIACAKAKKGVSEICGSSGAHAHLVGNFISRYEAVTGKIIKEIEIYTNKLPH